MLAGLLLYIRGIERDGWRSRLTAVALFAVAALGLFSKENAAVLIGWMVLWDVSFSTVPGTRALSRRAPAYAAVALSLGLVWWARHAVFQSRPWAQPPFVDNLLSGAGFWTARLTAVKVAALDLWLLICPAQLSSDRSYDQIPLAGWADPTAWGALLVVVGILAYAIVRRKSDRRMFWAAGFFGIALLPTSNLVVPIGSIMAERFLYLPSIAFAVAIAALAYRIRHERARAALLAAVLIALTVRTYARNLAWQDNLTLATADLKTAPRSFKLHTILAQELLKQDPRENIDRAIRELEAAGEILRPLTDLQMPQQSLLYLGDAYLVKGNLSGGPSTAEGRTCYGKALPVLERAREISRLGEKTWDEAQRVHGRPAGERFASQDLYYDLGVAYGSLGRYAEALDTLRYGRNINHARPDFYTAISAAYTGLLQPEGAAIALLESAQMDGERPEVLASLKQVYAGIPGGACALEATEGTWRLNPDCPRLRTDQCLAQVDLARAFLEARRPARARGLKEAAIHRYGCPVAPFE